MKWFILLALWPALSLAQSIGTIKRVDLTEDRPADPTYQLINFKMKNPGHMAQVILRQFPKRVRVEFEGEGLPLRNYTIASSIHCPRPEPVTSARYKSNWTEHHRFNWSTRHFATEKSMPKATLADFKGKAIGLFRVNGTGYELVACETAGEDHGTN